MQEKINLFFSILIYLTQFLKRFNLNHFFGKLFGRLEKIPVLCIVKLKQTHFINILKTYNYGSKSYFRL